MKFNILHQHPIWAMAFRPFYLFAALHGAVSIVLWGFGYTGTAALPGQYWHAHEMIWGYAGAIVVAFLLTAVATWTGQPPTCGKRLMVLAALWLLARLGVFSTHTLGLTAVAGTLFFWLATFFLGSSIVKSKNYRNYIAIFALFLFGLTHALFHAYLQPFSPIRSHHALMTGLMMVAGFIGLIGNRIIPFFTARRLNKPAVMSPMWMMSAALILPISMAILGHFQAAVPAAGSLAVLAGGLGVVQSLRWFDKAVLSESLLWILHAGYAATSAGLVVLGVSQLLNHHYSAWYSLGIHFIAVGGIGMLTIGMMTRTALGHTARPLYPAPKGITLAFWLMLSATALRGLASVLMTVNGTAYVHAYRSAAVLFALALLIFFWRYAPWLTQPRLDGKAG